MTDPHEQLKEEFFFITSAVSCCVGLLQMFGICSFNRIRALLIIQRRYPRLVIVEAFITCINLVITYPTNLSLQYSYYPVVFHGWWQYVSVGLAVLIVPIIVVIETCRIWLIAYDLQYLHSSKNQRWKTVIDASYAEKDWYLQNRRTWGNQQYVIKLGFGYWITTSTAVLTMIFVVNPYFKLDTIYVLALQGLCLAMPVPIPIYLYAKTPQNLRDQLLFFYEFTWTIIIILSGTLLAITCLVLLWLGYWTLGWMVVMIDMIYSCLPSLLSTILIPWKVSTMKEWDDTESTSKLELKHSPGHFRETLQAILIDEQKCEAFIDWMYREFSSEAILSFVEFVQFRQFVKEEIGKTDGLNITVVSSPYDFALYDGMPKSSIIYDTSRFDHEMARPSSVDVSSPSAEFSSDTSLPKNSLMRCKRIAHLLFVKYINYHSEHEINISGRLRETYVNLEQTEYDGINVVQFVTLYEDVIAEMMKYQSESYMRFEREHSN